MNGLSPGVSSEYIKMRLVRGTCKCLEEGGCPENTGRTVRNKKTRKLQGEVAV